MIDAASNSSPAEKDKKQSYVANDSTRTHSFDNGNDKDGDEMEKDTALIAATNALLRRYERLASMADAELEQDLLARKRQEARAQRERRDDDNNDEMSTTSILSLAHSSSSLADEINTLSNNNKTNDIVTRLAQERDEAIRDAMTCREQVEALLSAITLMARLAALKLPSCSQVAANNNQLSMNNSDKGTETTPPPPSSFASVYKPKRRRCGSVIRQRLAVDRPIVVRRSNSTGTILSGDPAASVPRLDENTPETNEATAAQKVNAEKEEREQRKELADIQGQLDHLFKQWNMSGETSVPSLVSSIHRLRSQVAVATDDAEMAHEKAQTARRLTDRYKSHCRTLQRAVEKLHGQSRDLKQQLRTARHQKRHLAQHVSHWAQRSQVLSQERQEAEVEERVLANHLLVHEGYLKMAAANLKPGNNNNNNNATDDDCSKTVVTSSTDPVSDMEGVSTVSSTGGGTRLEGETVCAMTRSDSPPMNKCPLSPNMSPMASPSLGRVTFQNFDQFSPPFGEIKCTRSIDIEEEEEEEEEDESGGGSSHPPERVLLPSISSLSSSSRHANLRSSAMAALSSCSSSAASLITDESPATIRITADSSARRGGGGGILSPLTLFTPRVPSVRLFDDAAATYRLIFPAGETIGIQIKKVPLEPQPTTTAVPSTAATSNASTTTSTTSNPLSLSRVLLSGVKGKVDDLANLMDETGVVDAADVPEYGFMVCGFKGFDDTRNSRPPVGSRLVRIDSQSLEKGKWTFDDVKNAIKSAKESTFAMTFRADPLSPKQQEIVDAGFA